jgi:hypothetical protein
MTCTDMLRVPMPLGLIVWRFRFCSRPCGGTFSGLASAHVETALPCEWNAAYRAATRVEPNATRSAYRGRAHRRIVRGAG